MDGMQLSGGGAPPSARERLFGLSLRTTLNRRQVLVATVVWVAVSLALVGFSVAGGVVIYEEYKTVCAGGDGCSDYWHLAPQDVPALQKLGLTVDTYAAYRLATTAACTLGFWAVGLLLFWKGRRDPLALLFSFMLMVYGALNGNVGQASEVGHALAIFGATAGFVGSALFYVSFFVFPDGQLVPRWGRGPIVAWVAYVALLYFVPDGSPLSTDAWPTFVLLPVVLGLLGVMVFAQIHRYRRHSDPVERQQTKWVVFGLAAAIVLTLAVSLPSVVSPDLVRPGVPKALYTLVETTISNLALLLLPLSICVAILRYRLWDIDVVINRTLVYGSLTASVVGLYALLVGSLGALLQARGSFLVALLSTGLVAVVFSPLRDRLQRGVNRLMYGERDDPYGVLSRLGRRLEAAIEPGAVLPTVVETVAGALKLPYAEVAIRRRDGFETAATHGTPTGGEPTVLPLVYGREEVGRLTLAPRAPGERFTPAELRLLGDLARHAEVAVQAVRLTADLQRSRERLVTAREEERRRLRRDLHDGLGPSLSGLAFGLDAARGLLTDQPEQADRLLSELKARTQESVSDIRRLVYGLRPPSLDDLGLVPAIREQAAGYGTVDGSGVGDGPTFSVEAARDLPPLSAAVEVACYRIAQEALANVARHARAEECRVRLAVEGGSLLLEVSDDGVGLPADRRAGVGLSSMRERASELGGTCVVEPGPAGGTRVRARLPLPDPQAPASDVARLGSGGPDG